MTRKTKNKRDDVPIPGPSLSFNNNSHDGENYLVDEEEATSALLRQMEVEGWGCRRSNRLAPAAPTISNTHPAAVESQDTPTTSSNNLPPNPQQKSQKKAAISRGKSTIVEKQVERQVDKDKDSKKRPRPSYKKPRENGGDSDNDSSSSENDSESGDDFRDEEYTIEEEKSDDEDDYTPLATDEAPKKSKPKVVKKSRRIKREPNEEEVEGFDQEIPEKETTNGRLMKRIKPQMNRVRNIDNTGLDVPDFTDLSNYVKAVVQSNSKLQTDLSAEAEDMEALFGPYIGADPFFGWERTFEISPSLSRWLNVHSMEFSVAGTVPKDVGERDRQFKGPRYIHRGRPLKFPKLEEIPHTLLSPAVKPISASATSSSSKDKRESTRKSGRKKVQTADQTNALNLAEPNKIDDIDLKLFGNDEFHNIPVFGSTSHSFDVDVSARTEHFESNQITDIRNAWLCKSMVKNELNEDSNSVFDIIDPIKMKTDKKTVQMAHILYCGGPIADLKMCPRKTSEGDEFIAISTFADEKLLMPISNTSYLQFWTFSASSDKQSPKLAFILEVPDSPSILGLNWCPAFRHQMDESPQNKATKYGRKKRSKNMGPTYTDASDERRPLNEEFLGLLAVATSTGKIVVYSIPRNITALLSHSQQNPRKTTSQNSTASQNSTPSLPDSIPVLCTEPTFLLTHPPVSIKGEEGKFLTTSQIPFIGVEWSPFGGRMIAAVSACWRVYIWQTCDAGEYSRNTSLQPQTIFSSEWISPPLSVCWIEENKLAIGFRRGGFVLLNVSLPNPLEMGPGNDGGLTVLINAQADTSRGLGSWVFSQPRVFPSNFITWDLCQPFTQHGITYHAATHVRVMDKEQHDDEENEEEEEGMEKSAGEKSSKYSSVESISLPSLHQIRVSRMSICPQTGIIASVGGDGRLVHELSSHLVPSETPNIRSRVQITRSILQLITRAKNANAPKNGPSTSSNSTTAPIPTENPAASTAAGGSEAQAPLSWSSHADCREHQRLEIRLGDCALIDHLNMRESLRQMPEAMLNRRLEALTAVDFSHLSPGLCACGGEAGLAFIVPSAL